MSREVVVKLFDDLDKSPADTTIEFTVEKVTYVLDLTQEHADQFMAELQPWMDAAHEKIRASATPVKAHQSQPNTRSHLALPADVRTRIKSWAIENGHQLNGAGLISFEIRSAYVDATGDSAPLDDALLAWRKKQRNNEIRRWASDKGLPVNSRGSIPEEVVVAYEKAHKSRRRRKATP